MTINIMANKIHSKHYIKKKTNEFFHCKNRDWIDRIYLFDGGILFRVFDEGVAMNSLCDTDGIYALVCKYIEFLFFDTEIIVHGIYDKKKLLYINGVRISEI